MKKLSIILIIVFFALSISAKKVSITEHGAIPNDSLDDCPALQLAVADIYNAGGGTITFPAGKTDLKCTQYVDISNGPKVVSVDLEGESKGSVVEVDMHQDIPLFFMGNLIQFNVRNLTFLGEDSNDDGSTPDDPLYNTSHLFILTNTKQAKFENVAFIGIGAKQSIIFSYSSDLIVENCFFGGSVSFRANIEATNVALTVKDTQMLDWASYQGKYYSKTPRLLTSNWIRWDQEGIQHQNAIGNRSVRMSNVRLDEGAAVAIYIRNNHSVRLEDININLSGVGGGAGVKLVNVRDAEIDYLWTGWKTGIAIEALENTNVRAKTVLRQMDLRITESSVDKTSTVSCDYCMEKR